MEYPTIEDGSHFNSTMNYATFANLYTGILYNNSNSSNIDISDEELNFKLKVLWYNYSQQLYDRQQAQLFDVPLVLVIVLSLLYGAISVTSLVGNGLVIWVVLGSKKMRTVTNLFICNLAVADLIIGLLVVPFHFLAALLQQWHLPHFLCSLCPFLQVLGVNLNTFTLCTIAVVRYFAVMRPLGVKTTKGKAFLFLALIWILSFALAFPTYLDYQVVYRTSSIFARPREFCHSVVYSPEARMLYNMVLFDIQYAIPVVIITSAYVRMGFRLWGRIIPGNQEQGRDAVILKNKKQAIKTFSLVVLLFGVCWMPFQVYNFLQYVIPNINHYQYINIIWFCMHWLAMSNSCVNPFVYIIYCENFQKQFRERILCCRKYDCPGGGKIAEDVSGSGRSKFAEGTKPHVALRGKLQVPGPSLQDVSTKLPVGLAKKFNLVNGVSGGRKENETFVTKLETKAEVCGAVPFQTKTEFVTMVELNNKSML